MSASDVNSARRGICPSPENPIPFLHHPENKCIYWWCKNIETLNKYCITRPTVVRRSAHHPLTTDEEPIDTKTINKGWALTITGATVIWDKDALPLSDDIFVTRYDGPGLLREGEENHILVVEDLQETFILIKDGKDSGCTNWRTTAGYKIKTCRIIQDNMVGRARRSTEDAYNALQGEINGKLNYHAYLIRNYLERFRTLCNRHNLLREALHPTLVKTADAYAKSFLNNPYLTASMTKNHIMVWPCKPVNEWSLRKPNGSDCSLDIPISYQIDGMTRQGFLNPVSYVISQTTSHIPCSTHNPQLFHSNGTLYLWTGLGFVNVPQNTIYPIPIMENVTSLSPKWSDTWLYQAEDFKEEIHYLTSRDLELRNYIEHPKQDEALYGTQLGLPFMGLPTVPSLMRCVELSAMLGGFLHLLSLLKTKLRMWLIRKYPKNYERDDPLQLDTSIRERQAMI